MQLSRHYTDEFPEDTDCPSEQQWTNSLAPTSLDTADLYDAALYYSDFIINVFYHSRIDEGKMTDKGRA